MMEAVRRFLKEDEGASMAEYAILLAVITAALLTALQLYTNAMGNVFNAITNKLGQVISGAGGGSGS